ncbi:hypothetical protein BDP27DRAFT_1376245 [Rhodocollybia butyracea]|uniref:Uncharacterized protein n=1 Tax=Rhodocollybia butyracea TaxID=206335 RepID=A0A9P5P664_9AGAR|nr:hypothetical protein BDP27DRAFT_1376245 [Rhodocollybia butyracea]
MASFPSMQQKRAAERAMGVGGGGGAAVYDSDNMFDKALSRGLSLSPALGGLGPGGRLGSGFLSALAAAPEPGPSPHITMDHEPDFESRLKKFSPDAGSGLNLLCTSGEW